MFSTPAFRIEAQIGMCRDVGSHDAPTFLRAVRMPLALCHPGKCVDRSRGERIESRGLEISVRDSRARGVEQLGAIARIPLEDAVCMLALQIPAHFLDESKVNGM